MTVDVKQIGAKVEADGAFVEKIFGQIRHRIVGQEHLVRALVNGLLSNGHVLLEGVPGLAKTLSVSTLAQAIKADFKRIQFTPDLSASGPYRHVDLQPRVRRVYDPAGPGLLQSRLGR